MRLAGSILTLPVETVVTTDSQRTPDVPSTGAAAGTEVAASQKAPAASGSKESDRRHHRRVVFRSSVHVAWLGGNEDCRLKDLSFKGALLEGWSQPVPPLGEPVILGLTLEGETRVVMVTEVAHVEGDQIGLLCRSISLDAMTALRQLMGLNLGDEVLLERELAALLEGG